MIAFLLSIALWAAQSDAPGAAPPERLVPIETAQTREGAELAREALLAAREFAQGGRRDEAREALRGSIEELLAVPGREASAELADALQTLGNEAASLRDSEWVVRALEPVLQFRIATLGRDAEEVQRLRATLGTTSWSLGRYDKSREWLGEALEWAERTLEPADPRRLDALSNWAVTLYYQGELGEARARMNEVVARLCETHERDDPEIQWAFANQANVLDRLGDVDGAVAIRERVHRVLCRSRPADHPDVMTARQNLALSLRRAGDPIAARALLESVDAWNAGRYPPNHAAVLRTRQNLALVLRAIGDGESARILLSDVVDRLAQTRPEDDPSLLTAKQNLKAVLSDSGRHAEAAALAQDILDLHRAALGPEHVAVLEDQTALAFEWIQLGRGPEASELLDRTLKSREERHAEDEYGLLLTLASAGYSRVASNRAAEAVALFERAHALASKRLGPEHDLVLRLTGSILGAVEDTDPVRARKMSRELARQLVPRLERATAALSPREAELSARNLGDVIDIVVDGCRAEADVALAFEAVETARLAAWSGSRALASLERACVADAEVRSLRDDLRVASARVAVAVENGKREQYQQMVFERAALERRLAERVRGYAQDAGGAASPTRIAAQLGTERAAISIRRVQLRRGGPEIPSTENYVAFVLRAGGELRRLDLGDAAAIDRAIEGWRSSLGIDGSGADAARERRAGEELRQLVVDKLRAADGGARRWVIALDDALHLVPLDALPLAEGVLGDTVRVEVRTHLAELESASPRAAEPAGTTAFLALGGIDFDTRAEGEADARPVKAKESGASQPAESKGRNEDLPRARRFAPLAGSGEEVEALARLFRAFAGESAPTQVLMRELATKRALIESAPRARWLHVATHGYFAPETVISLADDPREGADFAREVRGLSPRVLCGLALAGANAPESLDQRGAGVLTAEELACLDLSGCELAVLSACDTGLGVRRAGQSVASLQSALHAAGSRSALTALWPVSDAQTRELMLSFYRHLWQDRLSKDEALWRAKQELRAKRMPTRAWAGWVLSGDPR